MIYVFNPVSNQSGIELMKGLDAHLLRRFDGMDFWKKGERVKLNPDDIIICWGGSVPEIEGIRVLNGVQAPMTKLDEVNKLHQLGIPTISLFKSLPKRHNLTVPIVIEKRSGYTLIVTPSIPDFSQVREQFHAEYVIHSFNGRSIRAGTKVPREGYVPCDEKDWKPGAGLIHPWVKSHVGGWDVQYDGFQSTARMRKLAQRAVQALGLIFGAVTIGDSASGTYIISVSRTPDITGGTLQAYIRAIQRWVQNPVLEVEK